MNKYFGHHMLKLLKQAKNLVFKEPALTPQEESILKIMNTILYTEGTRKLASRNGPYYVFNDKLKYYVKVMDTYVLIVDNNSSITKLCTLRFSGQLYKLIDAALESEIEDMEAKFFDSDLKILYKIEDKLKISDGSEEAAPEQAS